MDTSNLEGSTQEGVSYAVQSLPASSDAGSPTYSGGGTNCFVGRQSAGLRKHNHGEHTKDIRLAYEMDTVVTDAEKSTPLVVSSANDPGKPKGLRIAFGKEMLLKGTKLCSRGADKMSDHDESVGRKRPLSEVVSIQSDASGSDSELRAASIKCSSARRGRATGNGLARAKADLRALTNEAEEAAFEKALKAKALKKKKAATSVQDLQGESGLEEPLRPDPEALAAEELRALAGKSAASIIEVTRKSGHLQGGMIKTLKEASRVLLEIVEALVGRTAADETRRLRADNSRLHREVENLRAELKAHRREFSVMTAAAAKPAAMDEDFLEELKRSIITSVGVMVNARFAGIEERLLPERIVRPPLASDRRRDDSAAAASCNVVSAPPSPILISRPSVRSKPSGQPAAAAPEQWTTVVRRGKKKSSKATVPPAVTPPAARPSPQNPPGTKGKPGKRGKRKERATKAVKKKTQPKLPSPRPPAVIISLQAGAAEKGITYAQVLERAAEEVNLGEFGLEGGLKIRRSATGARLLELPKAASERAEPFATKLRTVLDGLADVVRPIKRVVVKMKELDDSVTEAKMVAAICRVSKCSGESIHVGEIRWGLKGMGVSFVRCPVDVAKKLVDAGTLLVGWSSAKVELLNEKPLRCFGCQEPGHTRAMCPSEVDRSSVCFRCGLAGHTRALCTGVLRCAVCADLGLQAGHEMGSRACKAPRKKGRAAAPPAAALSGVRPKAPVEAMST